MLENVIGLPGLIAMLAVVAILFLTYLSAETITVVRKILNPVSMITNRVGFYVTNNADDKTTVKPADDNKVVDAEPDPETFEDPATQTVEFPDNGTPVVSMSSTSEKTDEEEEEKPQQPVEAVKQNPDFVVTGGGKEDDAKGEVVAQENPLDTPINPKEPWVNYKYPTLSLLKKYDDDDEPYIDMKEQTANKNRIVEVLNSFGVQIKTISATVGPTITLYEITPAEGVKISRIRNLEDDIALSLKAIGVRIIAPIPGKGTIGIEVPNDTPSVVPLKALLNSDAFRNSKAELPVAIGYTITREVKVFDLTDAPHLLVAGATKQGKSVGLNVLIASLLYAKHPSELKFVFVDPKSVEFTAYSHLLHHYLAVLPDSGDAEEERNNAIVTKAPAAEKVLKSLCVEMDDRYETRELLHGMG